MSTPESKGAAANRSLLLDKFLAWLPTAIAAAAAVLWVSFAGLIAPEGQKWSLESKLVLQVAGLLVLVVLYLAGLCLRLWLRTRTRIRFGVLWNADKQPICAKCNGPLEVLSEYSFFCPLCQRESGAHDLDGVMMAPRDAMARMSGRKSAPAHKSLKYPDRSEEDENKVLRLLAKNPRLTAEEIAVKIKASTDVAQLYLNNLFDEQFVQWYHEHQLIDPSAPRAKKGTLWKLQDKGVAYLLERGWHK